MTTWQAVAAVGVAVYVVAAAGLIWWESNRGGWDD